MVADRYSYSGIVYTMSKGSAVDWDWCLRSEQGLPRPDLVLCLLPRDATDLETRGGFGDERFERTDFQTQVIDNYHHLGRVLTEADWDVPWHVCTVDSDMSPAGVHSMLAKVVESRLGLKLKMQAFV